ncbi:AAA-associated domain-containing protein, partial [Candidatus Dependentiae bacterium]|nr:AAA-associated domain-containing protein [Candidatus Dependentiae bacterium]
NKKERFIQYFDFDKRQADYYFNAAKYLDLVYIKKGIIFLTELGNEIANLNRKQRHGYLIREILSRKVFFDTYLKIKGGEKIEKEQVVEIMKQNNVLEGKTVKMFERRAQTIISWCKWIDRKFRDEKTS